MHVWYDDGVLAHLQRDALGECQLHGIPLDGVDFNLLACRDVRMANLEMQRQD